MERPRWRQRLAPGDARRHHHPRPGPDLLAVPGGRARRSTHPVPGRVELTRLLDSRAVRDLLMVLRAVADPTNHLHVVAALRTPLFACGDDDLFRFHTRHRSLELSQPAARRPRRRRPRPCRPRLAARPLRAATLARPLGAARPDRPRPPGHGPRLRGGSPARRMAPDPFRHRPGPVLERGHGREPASVPRLGRAPTRGRRARRRGDPARNRRRRRTHHDDPRREGPGIPRHDRLGHVHQAAGAARTGRRGLPPVRPGGLQGRARGQDRRVRGLEADRRADELPRTDPPPVRGLHPCP